MTLLRDNLLAAWRGLRRSPGASALTILCLALGVAASATALSLAWTVTLRPLPFPDGNRLVRVWLASEANSREEVSIPDLTDIAAAAPAFEAFSGTARTRMVALFDDGAARLRGEAVSPEYFAMLGVGAQRGRLFGAGDHVPGGPAVALISDATWRRYFGADPDVVGRTLRSEGMSFEIAGVVDGGFEGSVEHDVVEFWIPLSHFFPAAARELRTARFSWAFGRLRPGASIAAAQVELDRLSASLQTEHGDSYRGLRLRAEPFAENWREQVRDSGVILLAAALVLLAIAVVNVGGLALARALDRRREFAMRAALGANTTQVALLPFAEAGLASVIGGVIGAAASPWLLKTFLLAAPIALPGYLRPEMNGPVLALVVALCSLAAMAAGALPALEARRAASASILRDGARGQIGARQGGRTSRNVVVAQVALTTALVVVAALLGRSYQALSTVPLGYRTDIARFAVTSSAADRGSDPAAFRARLATALRESPGVVSVGMVWPTLPPWDPFRSPVSHPGLGDLPPERAPRIGVHAVDPTLFETLGIQMEAGRGVSTADGPATAPIVVVSASLAERLGGAAGVIGTELAMAGTDPIMPARARIVGVAADVAWDGLGAQETGRLIRWQDPGDPLATRYDAYYAIDQVVRADRQVSLAARVRSDPGAAVEPLTRLLAAAAPLSAVHWTGTMADELAIEYRTLSFALFLSLAFAGGALLLAGIGVFAVLTHTVGRRLPELALRMALGASPGLVQAGVFRSGLLIVTAGCLLGGAAAALGSRALRRVLYQVGPIDGLAFGIALAILLTVTVAACWAPARRAARVDPMQALRKE